MTPRNDPAALHWLVGAELANYRAETGLSLSEAAEATGISRAKLGHMETGRYKQNPDDVLALLKSYEVDRTDVERVAALAAIHARKAWWAPWKPVVAEWFGLFLGLEGMAESVVTYEPCVIPGVLQTKEYAEAITAENNWGVRRDLVGRFAKLRLARAARLHDPIPLRLHAFIGESALRLRVGTSDMRQDQLKHLLALASQPNIIIQVVRPEDGVHNAMGAPLHVMRFTLARPIAFVQLLDDGKYLSAPGQVWSYIGATESLERVAMSPRDSKILIKSMIGKG